MSQPLEQDVQVRVLSREKVISRRAHLVLLGTALALGAGSSAFTALSYFSFDEQSLFDSPQDLQSLVLEARAATVTIFCEGGSGSGWAIDLEQSIEFGQEQSFKTEIVTNFHVVEACLSTGRVSISSNTSEFTHPGLVYAFDNENVDLALVVSEVDLPALSPALTEPEIGQWVMAVGSPGVGDADLLRGNVTFGRVTNLAGPLVVTDAAVNPGNSGGPLINSRGQVIGTNTWLADSEFTQNIAYAQGSSLLCVKIIDCSSRTIGWQPSQSKD